MGLSVDILNRALEQDDSFHVSPVDILNDALKQDEQKRFEEFKARVPKTTTLGEAGGIRVEGFIPRFPHEIPEIEQREIEEQRAGAIGKARAKQLERPLNEFASLGVEAGNAFQRGIAKTASDLVLGTPEIAARTFVETVKSLTPVGPHDTPEAVQRREELKKSYPLLVRATMQAAVAAGATADQLGELRNSIEQRAEEEFPRSEELKNIKLEDLGLQILNPTNPESRRLFVAFTAETAPQFAATLGVGVAGKAAGLSRAGVAVAAGSVGAHQESVNAFDEAKRRGATDSEALDVYATVFLPTAVLDAIGIDFILSKLPKGVTGKIGNIAAASLVEGGTEDLQEIIQALAVGDSLKEAMLQGLAAFGPGAFLGGTARAAIVAGDVDLTSRAGISGLTGIPKSELPDKLATREKREVFIKDLRAKLAVREQVEAPENVPVFVEREQELERLEREAEPIEPTSISTPVVEPEPTVAPVEPIPTPEPTEVSVTPEARSNELKTKTNKELNDIARDRGLKQLAGLKKDVVIQRIIDDEFPSEVEQQKIEAPIEISPLEKIETKVLKPTTEKQPFEMTREEFNNEFVFHATKPHLLETVQNEGIQEGSFFSSVASDAQSFTGLGTGVERGNQPVFGIRKREIEDIPPDEEDVFGQEFIKVGLFRRSGVRHIPEIIIKGRDVSDPHKAFVKQAISEGKITSHPDHPELTLPEEVEPKPPVLEAPKKKRTTSEQLIAESPAMDPDPNTGVVFSPTKEPDTSMQAEQELPRTHYMPVREKPPRGWTKTASAMEVFKSFENILSVFGKEVGVSVPIRSGRVFNRNALGQFHLNSFVIRLRHAHDITTATHEIGHAVHSLVLEDRLKQKSKRSKDKKPRGFKDDPLPKGVTKELETLGENLYKSANPPNGGYRSEGIAEYMRVLLLDPENASKAAPKFHKWFNQKFLPRHPKGAKAIAKAQDVVRTFQQQGSSERAMQHVVETDTALERARNFKRLSSKALSFESVLEGFAPMWDFVRAIEEMTGKTLPEKDNPYLLAKAKRGTHDGVLDRMVEVNMVSSNGYGVGPSLNQANSLVHGKERKFVGYLLAKRTIALINDPLRIAKGLPPRLTGLSLRDAEVTIEELEAEEVRDKPKIEKKRKKLRNELEKKKVSKLISIAEKLFLDTSSISALDSDIVITPRLPAVSRDKIGSLIDDIVNAKHPFHAFQRAAQHVYDWENGVLNYVAGFSPSLAEQVRKMRETDPGSYIPLARIFNEMEQEAFDVSRGTSVGTSGLSGESLVKRLFGGTRPVRNPFQTMRENARLMIRSAHDRFILEKVIALGQAYPEMGKFIEEVPRGKELAFATNMQRLVDEMKKVVKDADPDLAEIFEDLDLGDFAMKTIPFYTPARVEKAKAGERIIATTLDKGGKVRVFVIDAALYKSLDRSDSLHPDSNSWWSILLMDKFLRPSKRIFTLSTTGMNPGFALGFNVVRDLGTFSVQTQSSNNVFTDFYRWARAMNNGFFSKITGKESPELAMFMNLGGTIANQFAIDTAASRFARKQLFQGRVIRTIDPRNTMDMMRQILQIPENAPRAVEFKNTLEARGHRDLDNLSIEDGLIGLLGGKEGTTDFSAVGADELLRNMRSIIPFMGANLQGPRALVRAMKRTPETVFRRGLMLTALTIAIWWKHKDEEWYQRLNPTERHLFTYWEFGHELIRMPRPFEIGALFMAMPEAILNSWYRKDPEAVKEFVQVQFNAMDPVFAQFPIPAVPIVEESFEQYANADTFWEGPIVPRGLERRKPEQQLSIYSTQVAIFAGDLFNISPIRVDHFIRGIGGSMAPDLINMVGLGTPSDLREKELSDIPIAGRFFRRGGKVGTNPRPINDLYNEVELAQQEQQDIEEPESILERSRRLNLEDAVRALRDLSDLRSLTKEVKKRRAITNEMANIAENALRGRKLELNKTTEGYIHNQIRRFVEPKITKPGRDESDEEFKARKKQREANRKRAKNILLSVEATDAELVELHRRITKEKKGFEATKARNKSGGISRFKRDTRLLHKLRQE